MTIDFTEAQVLRRPIDHIVKIAGADHVGLGSDFDGVDLLPAQLQDVSTFPLITQGLLDRGYRSADIRKILGENTLRVLRDAERVADELRDERNKQPTSQNR